MRYVSTRGGSPPLGFTDAVAQGLAGDGGLLVPEELPDLSQELGGLEGLEYPELCFRFLRRFADDIPEAELRELTARSYLRFERPEITPLLELDAGLRVLELFHGPTLSFKDIALQLLGSLYARQCARRGGERPRGDLRRHGGGRHRRPHGAPGRRDLHPVPRRAGLAASGAADGLH